MTGAQLALVADPIDVAFLEFHHAHPEVYVALVRMARRLRARGQAHMSLRDAFGVLRYERALTGRDADGFKLNNSYASRYARVIAANEPDLAEFFTTRALARERGPYDLDLESVDVPVAGVAS